MKPDKNKRWLWIPVLILLLFMGVGLVYAWQTPLFGEQLPQIAKMQPALQVETPADLDQTTPPAQVQPTPGFDDSAAPDQPSHTPTQAVTTSEPRQPICGGPEALNLLVVGIDQSTQADGIRLVRLDFLEPSVTVLSIPRDLFVPIIDMAQFGITQGRINATYGYGEYFLGRGKGVLSLAANLEHNFGVGFDHYVVLQFSSLVRMIDKIGGVDIMLEKPVDGRLQNMDYYAAGSHHLDGEAALDFMRIRYPDTDIHRIDRQSLVLQALFSKARQDLSPLQQTRMAFSALSDRAVKTSLAGRDLGPLICLAQALEKDQIHLLQIPSEYYQAATTTNGASVLLPQPGAAAFIESVMNGTYQAAGGN